MAPDVNSDEWLTRANNELKRERCVECRAVGTASVSREIVAKPLGTFSLSGGQMKTSGSLVLVYRCSECGVVGQVERDI